MMSQLKPNIKIYERERIILQSIKDNPDLHHNGLIKLIVPQYMAKTTFENARNSLIEKEILFVKKKGNMKFYVPTPNYKEKSQQRLEQNTNKAFHDIKLKIKKDKSVNKAIGINEIKEYLKDEKELGNIKEKISIKTRQYAKRQSTWARGNMINWFKLQPQEMNKFLKKFK